MWSFPTEIFMAGKQEPRTSQCQAIKVTLTMTNCSSEFFVTQRGKTSPILMPALAMFQHHDIILCPLTQHCCIKCRAVGLSFKHMKKLPSLSHYAIRILSSAKELHWICCSWDSCDTELSYNFRRLQHIPSSTTQLLNNSESSKCLLFLFLVFF